MKRRTPASSRRPHHRADGRGWTVDSPCSLSGNFGVHAGAACTNFHPETETEVIFETLYSTSLDLSVEKGLERLGPECHLNRTCLAFLIFRT